MIKYILLLFILELGFNYARETKSHVVGLDSGVQNNNVRKLSSNKSPTISWNPTTRVSRLQPSDVRLTSPALGCNDIYIPPNIQLDIATSKSDKMKAIIYEKFFKEISIKHSITISQVKKCLKIKK